MNDKEGKVRRPKQSRSIQTKEAILKAAMELFSEKGFHHTNTKEIAARAGVSTGSFYSYYTDKREIFIETLYLYDQKFTQILIRSLNEIKVGNHDNRVAFMTHFVDSMIAAHDVYTEFHQEVSAMYYSDREIKELRDKQYQRGKAMTQEYLLEWKDELRVKDIEAASVVTFEVLNQLVDVIVFSNHSQEFADRIKSQLVQMITDYLFE